jgi:glycosyltransferase involved in cell wall biosynthesis
MATARHVRILAGLLDRSAGSHVYHLELATRLAGRGHRVSIVCFERPEGDREWPFEIVDVPRRRRGPLPGLWRFAAVSDALACSRGLRRARLDPPDVTIGGEHLFLKPHARRFPRAPWIYLPHSLVLDLEIAGYDLPPFAAWTTLRVYDRIQRWALTTADRTVRFTQYACDALAARHGTDVPGRFVVNPPGLDTPAVHASVGTSLPLRILTVGALTPGKRIDVALRALARLADVPWRYTIVGAGGQRDALGRLAEDLGIADRVLFSGQQSDPSPFYRDADLFLLPSRSESLGFVVLEAMSFGLPVLAMRADGRRFFNPLAEILVDGDEGFLAESDEVLPDRLRELLTSPARLTLAGGRARARVQGAFSWDRHLATYESLFDQLIDASPRATSS